MPKTYTNEELVDKVLEKIQFPDTGRKAEVKRNLMYVCTALGGTFIEVEEENE
jgi:hypothetical protein